MFDIYFNNNIEGIDFDTFNLRCIDICNEHKKYGRASLFAFIFYNSTNPQIIKMLTDCDYWSALDQISGKYLTVFSFKINNKQEIPVYNPEIISYMTSIDMNRKYLNSCNNQIIESYFGNIQNFKYPAIVFFQIDNNDVSDAFLITLQENEIEKSFTELKNYIESAVKSIKKNESISNDSQKIFKTIKYEINKQKVLNLLEKTGKTAGGIVGLVSSIKSFF